MRRMRNIAGRLSFRRRIRPGIFCHARWLLASGRGEEALAGFAQVLQLDPTFPGAHLHLGELHHRRRDRAQTRLHLRAEMRLRPQDPALLMDLANLLLDNGQGRAAIACLKRLVQIDPHHADAWQNLAVAQFMRRQYEEGIDSCRRAVECEPGNVTAAYNLAVACERMGRYDEGLVCVRAALGKVPRDVSLQKMELRLRVLKVASGVVALLRRVIPRGRERAEA